MDVSKAIPLDKVSLNLSLDDPEKESQRKTNKTTPKREGFGNPQRR